MSGVCRRNLPSQENDLGGFTQQRLRRSAINPMEQEELEGLEISISLGMMEQVKVEDSSQFREKIPLGRDRICLRLKGSSGTFFPEVATSRVGMWKPLFDSFAETGLEEDDWRNSETEVLCFQTKHLEAKLSGIMDCWGGNN